MEEMSSINAGNTSSDEEEEELKNDIENTESGAKERRQPR